MKYELWVGCNNIIGHGWLEKIVEMANIGATLKEGVLPSMKFPYSAIMEIEAEEEPTATPEMRVFREDKTEVYIKKIEAVKVEQEDGSFSMEIDPALATNDNNEPWTKEQLDAMEWKDVKIIFKAAGITGRDRELITRQYLAKSAESQ